MSNIMTGARARFQIDSQTVAYVSGVNVSREFALSDIDVLGQLETADLAETGHKCSFSISLFKAVNPKDGELPKHATAPVKGKEAAINSPAGYGLDSSSQAVGLDPMKMQIGFQAEILDEISGATLFVMEGCKFESGSGQVDARGVWSGSWSFRALRGYEP